MTINSHWGHRASRTFGAATIALLSLSAACGRSPDGATTEPVARALPRAGAAIPATTPPAPSTGPDTITFELHPNPKFLACFAGCDTPPTVTVTVKRGDLNDTLTLHGENFKPGLQFDLFTVQRTNLLANGMVDPSFKGSFGLAWYQSDLEADSNGEIDATIETILLDQIFGFDPDVGLAPTNTFNVGFWFNNPEDAVPCGFDATKPTPFNGEHRAGPLAMITVPDANTGLGPLCTKPDTTTTPAHCNP
jgi:hypothetical protein